MSYCFIFWRFVERLIFQLNCFAHLSLKFKLISTEHFFYLSVNMHCILKHLAMCLRNHNEKRQTRVSRLHRVRFAGNVDGYYQANQFFVALYPRWRSPARHTWSLLSWVVVHSRQIVSQTTTCLSMAACIYVNFTPGRATASGSTGRFVSSGRIISILLFHFI